MTIQYRCRCGQEVILRPREALYGVVAVILGLTLLNTVLTGLLWYRSTTAVTAAPDPALGAREDAPESPPPARLPVEPPVAPSIPDAVPVTVTALDDASASPVAPAVEPVLPPPPAEVRLAFALPEALDGLLLGYCLLAPPESARERAAVFCAGAWWGSGWLRETAMGLASRFEQVGLAQLIAEAPAERPDAPRIATFAPGEERAPARLIATDLAENWDSTWRRLGAPSRGGSAEPGWTWVSLARPAFAARSDRLLIVDLTESMESEVAALRTALVRMIPLLVDGRATQRWGWIGYRDDVVDGEALTGDGDRFVASLERWRCAEGGDVPEGVDWAIFEALRYGAMGWRSDAAHRILVVGDAPPPYERIAPMVSLVESAHASPEKYRIDTLGIVREAEFPDIPGFRALAAASGGESLTEAAGRPLAPILWRAIAGAAGGAWEDSPFDR